MIRFLVCTSLPLVPPQKACVHGRCRLLRHHTLPDLICIEMSGCTIHDSACWLGEGGVAVCHHSLCYMLERAPDVAGTLVMEVMWLGLAVAAVLALWWCLRMFDLQWPRALSLLQLCQLPP